MLMLKGGYVVCEVNSNIIEKILAGLQVDLGGSLGVNFQMKKNWCPHSYFIFTGSFNCLSAVTLWLINLVLSVTLSREGDKGS
jgi:hypothetical protein